MTSKKRGITLFSIGLALGLVGSPGLAEAQKWEEIGDEDGIKVWQRTVPGTSLVEFRGRGNVEAPIVKVFAVVLDNERKVEWMKSCRGAHTIEYRSATRGIAYNRTKSPAFFISDRDVVLDGVAKLDAGEKTVLLAFQNTTHKRKPPIDGVVRMPKLAGHWKLQEVDADTTHVEYLIQADPGGSLPKWLVNWASKKLPHHTLMGLRSQVSKEGYGQKVMIVERSFDWSGFLVGEAMADSAGTSTTARRSPG